ncbi:MAG: MerR family transcriptional regulator [Bacteroidetes bacterium]|nr:MerR family transcriptional regulator [Bacteroidota bacterium]MBU1679060.1 MerR family transcriptional regulator [Bacteroidota bacterium]MBU2506638.1 MerR family transcriptional regulator [Bacteroidota bacterium]
MNQIFIIAEFLKAAGITEEALKNYENEKLISPSGVTDDKVAFYTSAAVEKVKQIRTLTDLGYGTSEIHKIIKKVGLPKAAELDSGKSETEKFITVGNLAELVGISPRTIKHWEEKGIIDSEMRSEGGFRLYSEIYVYLCKLIKDLQLFGYSLDEIKKISDFFREFLALQRNYEASPMGDVEQKLSEMSDEVQNLFARMNDFKEGIERWEELLKAKKKEITSLKTKNSKRENK